MCNDKAELAFWRKHIVPQLAINIFTGFLEINKLTEHLLESRHAEGSQGNKDESTAVTVPKDYLCDMLKYLFIFIPSESEVAPVLRQH